MDFPHHTIAGIHFPTAINHLGHLGTVGPEVRHEFAQYRRDHATLAQLQVRPWRMESASRRIEEIKHFIWRVYIYIYTYIMFNNNNNNYICIYQYTCVCVFGIYIYSYIMGS